MRRGVIYGLLGLFFAGERVLRHGGASASLEAGAPDRGSTMAIGRAFGSSALALLAAPLLDRRRIGTLPRREGLFRLGVGTMVGGLALRIWAMRLLGGAYTRTLRTTDEQRLVQAGPYRAIRHPGYLATLLVWLGGAIGLGNALTAFVVLLTMLRAYSARIRAEEALLSEAFGEEYAAYRGRTWRLVPFIY